MNGFWKFLKAFFTSLAICACTYFFISANESCSSTLFSSNDETVSTIDTVEVVEPFVTQAKNEEKAYEEIYLGLKYCQAQIVLDGISKDDALDVLDEVENDHPELFWVNFQNFEYIEGDDYTKLNMNYSCAYSELEEKQKEFDSKVEKIISDMPEGLDTFDKILYIHDYIVDNTDYEAGESTTAYKEETSAYGCLISGKASCVGYSKAFQLLATKLGFECDYITGDNKENNEGHAWNCILIDGDYYYMDVTWDDADDKNGNTGDHKLYNYFCITTEELLEDHIIDSSLSINYCDATKYNYYVHEGLNFSNYDYDEIKSAINEKIKDNEISLRFETTEAFDEAVEDLIEGERIAKIKAIRNKLDDGYNLYYCKNEKYLMFFLD